MVKCFASLQRPGNFKVQIGARGPAFQISPRYGALSSSKAFSTRMRDSGIAAPVQVRECLQGKFNKAIFIHCCGHTQHQAEQPKAAVYKWLQGDNKLTMFIIN